jgi:hypothetical protein
MSKFSKFRNSPALFFADSKRASLRVVGRWVGPSIMRREGLLAVLENPVDALADGGLPVIESLARAVRGRARHQRRAVLTRAGYPTVSVVMSALNAAGEIERSLRSLLEQSYRQLEIIVVDDGSDDGTADVVRELARSDGRVRLISNAQRRGAARARNRGLHEASGAYLAFQDADDISHAERIERQLAALLEGDALICVCNSRRESPEGERIVVNARRFSKSFITMLFPRDPVFSRLGYMMDLRVGEDTEYYQRAKAVFGESCEKHLFQTLYRARFVSDSLLFSNSQTRVASDGGVRYALADDVKAPLDDALRRLDDVESGALSPFVPYDD